MSANPDQPKEDLHGDWLVVSRTKKGRNKAQSKGPSQSGNVRDHNKSSKANQVQSVVLTSKNLQGTKKVVNWF
ncbi:nitroreductase family deazaflavin-dependent oxidoreductase [Sesbania bispinosa]|nr:nitroreductase family deazaflavin-dependent oxidoreductase [Sesbania bispinosa]